MRRARDEVDAVLERLVRYDVRSLVSTPPTLEELFLRHYGDRVERSPALERV